MTTHAGTPEGTAVSDAEATQGVYVYGIVDASASPTEGLPSVGDGGTEVRTISYGRVAVLVSDLRLTRPLGTRDDLLAHERVLDSMAAETTVLPMRFGGVLSDADAVVDEVLEPHHDYFASVLGELAGLVQFTVRGRYVDDVHLHEIVAEEPEVAELREALRGVPEEADYSARLRLGELVNDAVIRKREVEAEALLNALEPHVVTWNHQELSGEDEAVGVALLVHRDHAPRFEQALDEFGERWQGRVQLRLVGPLAPYDFLPEA